MSIFKKTTNILIVFSITLSIFACSSSASSTLNSTSKANTNSSNAKSNNTILDKNYGDEDKDIVIFSTNDTLSSFNENLGAASIKHYMDSFDKKDNYATLVDTGNFSIGNAAVEKSNGKIAIEIMNSIGYDIVVPGSLDLSYGVDTFYENMNMLNSDVVCCNIYDTKNETYPFSPYVIYKYGNLSIGYVGVTSPEALFIKDNYDKIFNQDGEQLVYFFEDETGEALYTQIQTAVDAAKADGADKIILLAHLGIEDITEKWSTTKVIANTKDIDAVIDGHSMEVLDNGLMVNKIGAFIPIVQAGSRFKYLGAMNITKDDYIYPAVLKDRSINKKDQEFQSYIDKLLGE